VYAFIELHLAYHIDSTTLADGDYQLIPEPEGSYSEDPGNFIAGLSEAPNQSSEDIDLLTSDPPMKASPGHIPLFSVHCNLCLFICIYALSLGIVMKP
jgi:hypothetical protein